MSDRQARSGRPSRASPLKGKSNAHLIAAIDKKGSRQKLECNPPAKSAWRAIVQTAETGATCCPLATILPNPHARARLPSGGIFHALPESFISSFSLGSPQGTSSYGNAHDSTKPIFAILGVHDFPFQVKGSSHALAIIHHKADRFAARIGPVSDVLTAPLLRPRSDRTGPVAEGS